MIGGKRYESRYTETVQKIDRYSWPRRRKFGTFLFSLLICLCLLDAIVVINMIHYASSMTTGFMLFRALLSLFASLVAGIAIFFVFTRGSLSLFSTIKEVKTKVLLPDIYLLLGVPVVLICLGGWYVVDGAARLNHLWYNTMYAVHIRGWIGIPPTPAMIDIGRIMAIGALLLGLFLIFGRLALLMACPQALFVRRVRDGNETACPNCSYDLKGITNVKPGCPECGWSRNEISGLQ